MRTVRISVRQLYREPKIVSSCASPSACTPPSIAERFVSSVISALLICFPSEVLAILFVNVMGSLGFCLYFHFTWLCYTSGFLFSHCSSFFLPSISTTNIQQALVLLNVWEPLGPHSMVHVDFKMCATEMASLLCHLSFEFPNFPIPWNHVVILPFLIIVILLSLTNRFISVTPVISKVFGTVISDQLRSFPGRKGPLINRKYGFRPHHWTCDLAVVLHCQADTLNNYGETYLVSLEFSGSFDRLEHNGMAELPTPRFPPAVLSWTPSFLSK